MARERSGRIRALARLAMAFGVVGCSSGDGGTLADPSSSPVKVLFLGNSYTENNDLPQLLAQLVESNGHAIVVGVHSIAGLTLGSPQGTEEPHASNSITQSLIASDAWDFVVLQGQSLSTAIPMIFDSYLVPAVLSLDASIKANDPDTVTLLFQTWGRRDGGRHCWNASNCTPDFADFDEMQDVVTAGYEELSMLIAAPVAPVGEAWRAARTTDPGVDLFHPDGSHPDLRGSYLAACVFYARVLEESPVGASFHAGLPPVTATFLQQVAWDTVMGALPATPAAGPARPSVLTIPLPPLPRPIVAPLGELRSD